MKIVDGPFKDQLETSVEQYNRMPNWMKTDMEEKSKSELYEILGRWIDISENLEIKRLKKRIDKLETLLMELQQQQK